MTPNTTATVRGTWRRLLAVPNPLSSDREADRFFHNDLAELDDAALEIEARRTDMAIALIEDDDARAWHLERREAVRAELSRRRAKSASNRGHAAPRILDDIDPFDAAVLKGLR